MPASLRASRGGHGDEAYLEHVYARKGYRCYAVSVSSHTFPLLLLKPLLSYPFAFLVGNTYSMFVTLALICALTALPSTLASCGLVNEVALTFYGSPDDSPPQSDVAVDCGRGKNANGEPMAGGMDICLHYCLRHIVTVEWTGTGTFDNPMSFGTATDNQNLPRCAIIYVPLLRKYFRNEDDCVDCCT